MRDEELMEDALKSFSEARSKFLKNLNIIPWNKGFIKNASATKDRCERGGH